MVLMVSWTTNVTVFWKSEIRVKVANEALHNESNLAPRGASLSSRNSTVGLVFPQFFHYL